jgi:hypothetical protein
LYHHAIRAESTGEKSYKSFSNIHRSRTMFRGARLCLANPMAAKLRRGSRLEKRHRRGSAPIPLEQSKKSFNDYIVRRAGPNPDAQRRLKGMMLSSNKNLRAADYSNRRMAMQTAGDANELAHDANFGVSPMDVLAHGMT